MGNSGISYFGSSKKGIDQIFAASSWRYAVVINSLDKTILTLLASHKNFWVHLSSWVETLAPIHMFTRIITGYLNFLWKSPLTPLYKRGEQQVPPFIKGDKGGFWYSIALHWHQFLYAWKFSQKREPCHLVNNPYKYIQQEMLAVRLILFKTLLIKWVINPQILVMSHIII
jgi:hypothetical protein